MDVTQLAAIMAVILVSMAGVSIGNVAAMPEDLIGWDTPLERSWIYGHYLNDLKDDMLSQGMTEYQVSQRMDVLYYRYQMKIAKYTRMYNYINITELTTDMPVSVGNGSWSTTNVGQEGAPQAYAEMLVNLKIAEIEGITEIVSAETGYTVDVVDVVIDVDYEVIRRLTTYPGGPVYIIYKHTVSWIFY